MSGPMNSSPNRDFQARLNRMAERREPIEASKPQVAVIPDWKDNVRYPAKLVGAALLGMLAVFIARYVRFHLMGGTMAGDDADFTMMIDAALAAGVSFAIFTAMGFTTGEARRAERTGGLSALGDNPVKAAQVVGIAIMVSIMHNFVHAAPRAFDTLFSPEWTAEIVEYSEPGSLYFRGNYFVVLPGSGTEVAVPEAGEMPEEKALPKVRRMG